MTENNKPEWFEIAENDGPTAPPKASKTLPALAVFATALILGIGAVVAQIQEEPPAVAVDTASTQATSASNSAPTASTTPVTSPSAASTSASTPNLQNPSIAQLPTKRGGDDEGDDEGDHEGSDD